MAELALASELAQLLDDLARVEVQLTDGLGTPEGPGQPPEQLFHRSTQLCDQIELEFTHGGSDFYRSQYQRRKNNVERLRDAYRLPSTTVEPPPPPVQVPPASSAVSSSSQCSLIDVDDRVSILSEFTSATSRREQQLAASLRMAQTEEVELSHPDSGVEGVQQWIATLKQAVQDADGRIEELQGAITVLESENRSREESCQRQFTTNAKARAAATQWQDKVDRATAAASSTRVTSLVKTLREQLDRIEQLSKLLREAQEMMAVTDEELERWAKSLQASKDDKDRKLREMDKGVDALRSELSALEEEERRERGAANDWRERIDGLRALQHELNMEAARLRREIQQLQQKLAELTDSATTAQQEGKSLADKIMTSKEQFFRLDECMMLLKAAVINLDVDYRFIGQIREKSNRFRDKEHVFKEAHNEVKVAVVSIMGSKNAPPGERWHITDEDVQRLDDYRVRNVFRSLQEMVVCYDMMNDQTKADLTTAEEIVRNAEVLYAMARHTLRVENKKLEIAKQRATRGESRLTQPGNRSRSASDHPDEAQPPEPDVVASLQRRVSTQRRETPPDPREKRGDRRSSGALDSGRGSPYDTRDKSPRREPPQRGKSPRSRTPPPPPIQHVVKGGRRPGQPPVPSYAEATGSSGAEAHPPAAPSPTQATQRARSTPPRRSTSPESSSPVSGSPATRARSNTGQRSRGRVEREVPPDNLSPPRAPSPSGASSSGTESDGYRTNPRPTPGGFRRPTPAPPREPRDDEGEGVPAAVDEALVPTVQAPRSPSEVLLHANTAQMIDADALPPTVRSSPPRPLEDDALPTTSMDG